MKISFASALVGSLSSLFLPVIAAASGPVYAPGRVIVKFRESVTECAHCVMSAGRSFQSATADSSNSLDMIKAQLGVTAARSMFHHVSTSHRAAIRYLPRHRWPRGYLGGSNDFDAWNQAGAHARCSTRTSTRTLTTKLLRSHSGGGSVARYSTPREVPQGTRENTHD